MTPTTGRTLQPAASRRLGAHSATARNPPAVADAPVHGAQAKRAERAPAIEASQS